MFHKGALIAAVLLAVLFPTALWAQGDRAFFVNPFVGGYMLSDEGLQNLDGDGTAIDVEIDPAVLFGARLGVRLSESWKVEGAVAMAPFTATFEDFDFFDLDGDAQLFYGALNYHLPHQGPVGFFLSAGAGATRIKLDEVEILGETLEPEPVTDFLLNFGAGFGWELTPTIALRGDVKDHLQFCKQLDESEEAEDEDQSSLCPEEDRVLHNLEFSAGLSIRFGGR